MRTLLKNIVGWEWRESKGLAGIIQAISGAPGAFSSPDAY